MKTDLCEKLRGIVWVVAFALALMGVIACSDGEKTAGGSTEDAGIIAIKDLDVAGVTQKGPFVKGSAVTVQGIDCKTLKQTDEHFEGEVKSDKGDFTVKEVSLKSTCALFEVTGLYRSEITGKKSSKELTLRALTDLKDRENVNINILTNLEYERLLHLVTEKGKTFAEAKAQAEAEVLAAFDIAGSFEEFENLNIFESGDGNAALLAVSVMMQAKTDDAGLAKRLDKFTDSFAETGNWKDSATKATIADWAADAIAGNGLDSIRKNVEAWNIGDTVAAFEKYITAEFPDTVVLSSSSSKNPTSDEPVESSSAEGSSSSAKSSSSSVRADAGSEYDPATNTLKDLRDGKTYRTVTIENQVWMAENLNYEVENSLCYKSSADSCAKYGRLYFWAAAMDSAKTGCGYGLTCSQTMPVQGACPSGWHLPSRTEWSSLIMTAGGPLVAGVHLKAGSDWYTSGRGTDAFHFTALPAGFWNVDYDFRQAGVVTSFWSSTEDDSVSVYSMGMNYSSKGASLGPSDKAYSAYSVRCLKDSGSVVSSSDSSVASSGSVKIAQACKMNNSDYCEYETLTDDRDGQTYKTVKIGEQVWMAENLNYAYLQPTDSLDSTSFCYGNDPDDCEEYGRLYLWSAVMDSAATWSENGKGCGYGVVCTPTSPVRGVCPAGWHVPNRDEVMELIDAVGGAGVAGEMLISTYTGCIDEVDLYGFTFRSTGRKRSAGYYDDVGEYGYMWTITDDYWNSDESVIESNAQNEYVAALSLSKAGSIGMHGYGKNMGLPVRCLKD